MAQKETPNDDLDGIKPAIYKRRWKILASLCASLLVVMVANSSLNLALPGMAVALNLSSTELTWIVDIYVLVFASLLFTASTVADRFGRKRIMQAGLIMFVLGTVYAGFFATTSSEVIAARAIMGIGGAMVMPTTLSILNNIFPRKERPRAIAIWSGIAGGGIALGSIASGFLLEHYTWESLFVFSAIIGAVGLLFNQFLTPESRDENKTPVDWFGGVLSVIGLLGLVYAIVEAPVHGLLAADVMIGYIVGIIALATFVWWQKRTKYPMLDMSLFKHAAFSVSAVSVMLAFFALMGAFFSMSQLFQLILGYTPIESAVKMLPIMLTMILFSPIVPNIVKKIGARWTVTAGLLLISISFLIMSRWTVDATYFDIIWPQVIMMAGMSLTMTPATSVMMAAVPRNRAGMGSAMNDTTRELGGALGIAVLGSVLSSVYGSKIIETVSGLPAQAMELIENSLPTALVVAKDLGAAGETIALLAKEAWMSGLSNAFLIGSAIVFIAAIIAVIWLPHSHKQNEDDTLTAANN